MDRTEYTTALTVLSTRPGPILRVPPLFFLRGRHVNTSGGPVHQPVEHPLEEPTPQALARIPHNPVDHSAKRQLLVGDKPEDERLLAVDAGQAAHDALAFRVAAQKLAHAFAAANGRSEEHTSELQSLTNL